MMDLEEEFQEGSLLSAIIGIERIVGAAASHTIRIGNIRILMNTLVLLLHLNLYYAGGDSSRPGGAP